MVCNVVPKTLWAWPFQVIWNRCYSIFASLNPLKCELCSVCCESFFARRLLKCQYDHKICKMCFKKSTENYSNQTMSKIYSLGFPCTDSQCQSFISFNDGSKLVSGKKFFRIKSEWYESELIRTKKEYEKCLSCNYPVKKTGQVCRCTNCSVSFCFKCLRKCNMWHSDVRCKLLEDQLISEALIHRCLQCKIPFVKADGCNHMTCRCGAQQCYACRMPYVPPHSCPRYKRLTAVIEAEDVQEMKKLNGIA